MAKQHIIDAIDKSRHATAVEMTENKLSKFEWQVAALDLYIENALDREVTGEEKMAIEEMYNLVCSLQEEHGDMYNAYK